MPISRSSHSARPWQIISIIVIILIIAAGSVVYLGVYNVAADVPHTRFVQWVLTVARDHAIAVHARAVRIPPTLNDPQAITTGAGLYAEMCSSCHLAPGMQRTEISQGLDPRAPTLSRGTTLTPAETYWVIKHGITMTGMAAWGPTHRDPLIWDMVAFLRILPTLSPAQYKTLVNSAPETHDEMMDHPSHDPPHH